MQVRENFVHLVPRQHHRETSRLVRPLHSFQLTDLLLQHLPVEKKQRAKTLILGRRGHVAVAGQMRQKGAYLHSCHLPRVPPGATRVLSGLRRALFSQRRGQTAGVKADKALDPIPIRAFRSQRIMFQPHQVAHLIL